MGDKEPDRIAYKNNYGNGGLCLPIEGYKCTCLFYWYANLDKITQKHIKPSSHQHKQLYYEYKDAKSMEDTNVNYHVFGAR